MSTPSRATWWSRGVTSVILVALFVTGLDVPASEHADAASTMTIGANGQGTLLFVGDSLTVGSVAFGSLTERIKDTGIWSKVIVDAKVGRKASQGVEVLKKRIGRRTTAVVVALGANDMISRREPWYPAWVIKKVMRQSIGRPVLWINPKFSPTGRRDWVFRATRFNRALRAAQRDWPNLSIADWNTAFVPTGRSRFIADGVHLTVSGYKTRATFCVEAVEVFGQTLVDSTTTTTTLPLEPTLTLPTTFTPTSTPSTSTTDSTPAQS